MSSGWRKATPPPPPSKCSAVRSFTATSGSINPLCLQRCTCSGARTTGVLLRLSGTAFGVLAAWSAARAARAFWGQREALWAAVFTAVFLTFDTPSAVLALTPDLLTVPLHFAAVALAATGFPLWAGLAAGVALLFNAKALLILAACLLWQWRRAHLVVAGFAAPLALALAWMGVQGSLVDFWQQVWVWGRPLFARLALSEPLLRRRPAHPELVRLPHRPGGGRRAGRLERGGLALGRLAASVPRRGVPRPALLPALLLPPAAGAGAARRPRLCAAKVALGARPGTAACGPGDSLRTPLRATGAGQSVARPGHVRELGGGRQLVERKG